MNDLERFQAEHGQAWTATTQSPAFAAAFSIANIEKLRAIMVLTDEEIATRGSVILADLRGHLNYEEALMSLNQPKKFVFQDLGQPTYPNPEEELIEEQPETETANAAATFTIDEFGVPPAPIPPKPKRKYRKRRKRRKQ